MFLNKIIFYIYILCGGERNILTNKWMKNEFYKVNDGNSYHLQNTGIARDGLYKVEGLNLKFTH